MVHDPISALMGRTYEATEVIKVQKITGTVKGEEIPVDPGYYKYLGSIIFQGNKMTIDLYYDSLDDNTKDPI